MKKGLKGLSMMMAMALMLLSSGCVSHMVLEDSRQKVALRNAIASNDQAAIRAVRLGDDSVGLGIDLLSMDVITEQPLKQLGAAIADAAILYGTYEGAVWLNDEVSGNDSGEDGGSQTSGGDANRITVNGDGNTVHVGDDISTYNP